MFKLYEVDGCNNHFKCDYKFSALYIFCVIVAVWSRLKFECKAKISSGLRCHCRYCLKKVLVLPATLQLCLGAHSFTKCVSPKPSASLLEAMLEVRPGGASQGGDCRVPLCRANSWPLVNSLRWSLKQVFCGHSFQIPARPKSSLLLMSTWKHAETAVFAYFYCSPFFAAKPSGWRKPGLGIIIEILFSPSLERCIFSHVQLDTFITAFHMVFFNVPVKNF